MSNCLNNEYLKNELKGYVEIGVFDEDKNVAVNVERASRYYAQLTVFGFDCQLIIVNPAPAVYLCEKQSEKFHEYLADGSLPSIEVFKH